MGVWLSWLSLVCGGVSSNLILGKNTFLIEKKSFKPIEVCRYSR